VENTFREIVSRVDGKESGFANPKFKDGREKDGPKLYNKNRVKFLGM